MTSFVGRVKDIYCFVNVLLLFVFVYFTHIQLIHRQILLVLHLGLLLTRRQATSRRRIIILVPARLYPPIILPQSSSLPVSLPLHTPIEALARLPQLVNILTHIILIIIIPRAAHKIILLAVVDVVLLRLRLETRGRGTGRARRIVRLLAVYLR